MKAYIRSKLSRKTRLRLYKFVLALSRMDFSYIRPVILGTLLGCLIYLGVSVDQSYIDLLLPFQKGVYFTALAFIGVFFLVFLLPFIRKYIARFKLFLYRRKKRAYWTLFPIKSMR